MFHQWGHPGAPYPIFIKISNSKNPSSCVQTHACAGAECVAGSDVAPTMVTRAPLEAHRSKCPLTFLFCAGLTLSTKDRQQSPETLEENERETREGRIFWTMYQETGFNGDREFPGSSRNPA